MEGGGMEGGRGGQARGGGLQLEGSVRSVLIGEWGVRRGGGGNEEGWRGV